MNSIIGKFKHIVVLSLYGVLGLSPVAYSQNDVVTVRFANPQNNCATEEYCLDVEFKANVSGLELFGMNIRFFYDEDVLELVDFRDFQGGYGVVAPDPPVIATSVPAGPALFNFNGAAEFINGAMQLVNTGAPPILLEPSTWTKLFQICFLIDDPTGNMDTFCPSVVWDLEQDPENGGFLSGDDGVVMTAVDPQGESTPVIENVEQYNWEYIGSGNPPFGQPVDSTCSNVNCTMPVEYLFFKGTSLEEGNFLDWQTISEWNVDGFEVQRSNDRRQWLTLGFVKSGGLDNQKQAYSFMDYYPGAGVRYYRLRQRDLDGKIQFSSLVSLNSREGADAAFFKVYPNPAAGGELHVYSSQGYEAGGLIRMYGPTGQLVTEQQITAANTQLDVRGLPSGMYLVSVISGGQIRSEKTILD